MTTRLRQEEATHGTVLLSPKRRGMLKTDEDSDWPNLMGRHKLRSSSRRCDSRPTYNNRLPQRETQDQERISEGIRTSRRHESTKVTGEPPSPDILIRRRQRPRLEGNATIKRFSGPLTAHPSGLKLYQLPPKRYSPARLQRTQQGVETPQSRTLFHGRRD